MASAVDEARGSGSITPVLVKSNVTPLAGNGRKPVLITANIKREK